jgi:hypothetical protein
LNEFVLLIGLPRKKSANKERNETMLSDLIDDAWQEMVVGGEGRAREIQQQLILQKFDG